MREPKLWSARGCSPSDYKVQTEEAALIGTKSQAGTILTKSGCKEAGKSELIAMDLSFASSAATIGNYGRTDCSRLSTS